MVPSFHNADESTHRRVMAVGLLFCLAFVVISFSLPPQAESGHVLVAMSLDKADRLVRTAGRTAQGELTPDDSAFNGPAIFRLAICAKSQWR